MRTDVTWIRGPAAADATIELEPADGAAPVAVAPLPVPPVLPVALEPPVLPAGEPVFAAPGAAAEAPDGDPDDVPDEASIPVTSIR
jgi:hypothetical protein